MFMSAVMKDLWHQDQNKYMSEYELKIKLRIQS